MQAARASYEESHGAGVRRSARRNKKCRSELAYDSIINALAQKTKTKNEKLNYKKKKLKIIINKSN